MLGKVKLLQQSEDGIHRLNGRIWIPKELQNVVMAETHKSKYTMHPGIDKMYKGSRNDYWWPGMNRSITQYVERCLTCLQVKKEHRKPSGYLQQLEILVWKWDKKEFVDLVNNFSNVGTQEGKKGKLSPRYIGPFKIVARVGEVAYRLELPEELRVNEKLRYNEEPIQIIDKKIMKLRSKPIPLVKLSSSVPDPTPEDLAVTMPR
ncbi:putative reverse transcriptase domain-containing protein [Tanacetum coccineum]